MRVNRAQGPGTCPLPGPRLVRPGAKREDRTTRALGSAGMARAPPVNDQEMSGLDPLGPGQESAELIVDLLRVIRPSESETL